MTPLPEDSARACDVCGATAEWTHEDWPEESYCEKHSDELLTSADYEAMHADMLLGEWKEGA
jgi:hypothetical protein